MAEAQGIGVCHRCGQSIDVDHGAYCGPACREAARTDALDGVVWTPPAAWTEAVKASSVRQRKVEAEARRKAGGVGTPPISA